MENLKYEELLKSISEVMKHHRNTETESKDQMRKSEQFKKFIDTFKNTSNYNSGTRIINL